MAMVLPTLPTGRLLFLEGTRVRWLSRDLTGERGVSTPKSESWNAGMMNVWKYQTAKIEDCKEER
jgi:hypothetical protein